MDMRILCHRGTIKRPGYGSRSFCETLATDGLNIAISGTLNSVIQTNHKLRAQVNTEKIIPFSDSKRQKRSYTNFLKGRRNKMPKRSKSRENTFLISVKTVLKFA